MYVGREWPNLGGLAPRHTQRPPTYRDPFFHRPCQKKNRHSIHYSSSCRGKHLIGDIAMVIVKFRPRWSHTRRYALHFLYCLIENRFLYIKYKERSIDCTSALMFVLSILKLSRNAVELQTVS